MSLRSHTLRLAASLPEGEVRSELEKLAAGPAWQFVAYYSTRNEDVHLSAVCTVTNWSGLGKGIPALKDYLDHLDDFASSRLADEVSRLGRLDGVVSRLRPTVSRASIKRGELSLEWAYTGDLIHKGGAEGDPVKFWKDYFENAGFTFLA